MFDFLKRKKQQGGKRGHFMRMFAAAECSRLLSPWVWDGGFSNADVAAGLAVIRARSRDMAKNSEHYLRWLDLFVANVIGDGVKFKAVPSVSADDPTIDEAAAKFLQYHWWKWCSAADMAAIRASAASRYHGYRLMLMESGTQKLPLRQPAALMRLFSKTGRRLASAMSS